MSLKPNPLNSYRTYNYRWSMGVLTSAELANPMSYKDNGGSLVFIRSGGLPNKNVTTFIEDELGINVEFFIDELEYSSLVSFNPGTSTSNAVQFEFTVIEPYSIGLFFQTLALAANKAGYSNYIEAPYLLSVDFVGHKDDGTTETTGKKTFAIKLVNVGFSADASGSVYTCQAIPFNHMGFLDDYQEMNKNMQAFGDTVGQVLDDLTTELNRQETDMVADGTKLVGNKYKITFPTQGQVNSPINQSLGGQSGIPASQFRNEAAVPLSAFGPVQTLSGNQVVSYDEFGDPVTQAQQEASVGLDAFGGSGLSQAQREATVGLDAFGGSGAPVIGLDAFGGAGEPVQTQQPAVGLDAFGGAGATVIPGVGIDQRPGANSPSNQELQGDLEAAVGLDAFGGSGPNIPVVNTSPVVPAYDPSKNQIGNSLIIPDFNNFGTIKFAEENKFYDTAKQIFDDARFTISENGRVHQFGLGSKLEKIIEAVILHSVWGREIINQTPDSENMISWFKIDVKTKIISTEEMRRTGRPALEFEYVVSPYKINQEKFLRPSSSRDYTANINAAKKGYYYSYTGLNTDIINFDFKIDNSFYKPWTDLQSDPSTSIQFASSERNRERYGYSEEQVVAESAVPLSAFGPVDTSLNIQQNISNYNQQFSSTGGMGGFTDKRQIAEMFNLLVLNSDVDNIQLDLKIWGDPYYLSDSDAGNYRAASGSLYEDADGAIDFHRSEVDILVRFNSGVDIINNLLVLDPINQFNGLYRIVQFNNVFKDGQFTQELSLLRRGQQDAETVETANAIIQAATQGQASAESAIREYMSNKTTAPTGPALLTRISPEYSKISRLGDINIDSFSLSDPLGGVISQIGGSLGDLGGFGGQILSSISNSANAFSSLFNVTSLVPGLSQTVSGFTSSISQISGAVSQIGGQFSNIASTLGGQLGQVSSPLNNLPNIGGALDQVAGQFTNIPNQVAGDLTNGFRNATGSLVSQLNAPLGQLGQIQQDFANITSQISQPLQQFSSASNAINNLQTNLEQGLNLKSNLLNTLGQSLNLPNPITQNIQQLEQSLADPQAFMSQIGQGAIQQQAQKLLGPELRQKIQEVEKLTGELKNLEATLNQKISNATKLFDNVGKASTSTQDNIIPPGDPLKRLGPR